MEEFKARLDTLEANQKDVKDKLEENTRVTNEIKRDTKEIVDIFKAAKSGVTFIRFVLSFLKWLGGIVITLLGVWYAIRHHGAPPPTLPNILDGPNG